MLNALTFDLEFWWCSEFLHHVEPEKEKDYIEETARPILEILEKYGIEATFFVLGKVAERYPRLVKSIQEAGHEIASHGYSHKLIWQLGRKGFEDDVKKSVDILKSITGKMPGGFRASNFSLNRETSWALDILERLGFEYDSSIFPANRKLIGLYGEPNAPLQPYRPSKSDITKPAKDGIMEFPLTACRILGVNVPVAGGFYLRFWPLWFLKMAIRNVNKQGRPAIIYVHPWEAYPKIPRRELSFSSRFKRRYGMSSALGKLECLLKKFDFCPIRDLYF
jgi:polysaccharide deacetylase family protein (PEP-CTERM system associated)